MPSPNEDILKRLRLSKILGILGLLLLLASYVLGVFFTYIPEGEEKPLPNESYNPFSFLDLEYDENEYPIDNTFIAFIGGYHSLPVWRVSLEAPQYPKSIFPGGIPVFFNLTRFSGEVEEMDTINHYIGMERMEVGAPGIRRAVPIIYLFFFISVLVFLFYNGPLWWVFGLVPALMPVYFVSVFSYWLYWFGHNLRPTGAITIKPFMPTVFGDGKVAQFTTHSYPTVGFYVLLALLIVMALAILIRRRAMAELKAERAAS